MQYPESLNPKNRCQRESIGLGRSLINGYKDWLQAQYYAEIPQRIWPMPLEGISPQERPVARRTLLCDLDEPSLITLFTLRLLRKLRIARGLTKWSGTYPRLMSFKIVNARYTGESVSSQWETYLKNHTHIADVSSRRY